MQEQEWAAPQPATRTLRVLLLICAGALAVIVITLIATVQDAQSVQIAVPVGQYCGMSIVEYNALPIALQHRMNAQCVLGTESER